MINDPSDHLASAAPAHSHDAVDAAEKPRAATGSAQVTGGAGHPTCTAQLGELRRQLHEAHAAAAAARSDANYWRGRAQQLLTERDAARNIVTAVHGASR